METVRKRSHSGRPTCCHREDHITGSSLNQLLTGKQSHWKQFNIMSFQLDRYNSTFHDSPVKKNHKFDFEMSNSSVVVYFTRVEGITWKLRFAVFCRLLFYRLLDGILHYILLGSPLRLSPLPTAFLSSKLNSLEGLANQGKAEEEIILKLGSRHLKQNHSFSIESGSLNKLIRGEMKTLFYHKKTMQIYQWQYFWVIPQIWTAHWIFQTEGRQPIANGRNGWFGSTVDIEWFAQRRWPSLYSIRLISGWDMARPASAETKSPNSAFHL